jgi:hypothetical protein
MKKQRVAAFGCPHPRGSLTGEGDLLAAEARLVADHSAGAALALKAVAHGDARWFALNRKVKLPSCRPRVEWSWVRSAGYRYGRSVGWTSKRCTMAKPVAGPERPVRTFECKFVPLTWHFVQKGLSLAPPPLNPIECLISATAKRL